MGKVWTTIYRKFTQIQKIKKNSLLSFISNEKTLRCRSRLAEAKRLNFDSKNPILQRNCSRYTEVTVLKFHQDVYHNGAMKQHFVNWEILTGSYVEGKELNLFFENMLNVG